jgi:hypothetical protein
MAVCNDTAQQLSQALGKAVVRIWGHLPHDVQHNLFEEVIASQGKAVRPHLAAFLHDKHPRTSTKAREMEEPDSLGG